MCNQLAKLGEFYNVVVYLPRRPYTRMPAKMLTLTALCVGPYR